jgi:hypothetical protein
VHAPAPPAPLSTASPAPAPAVASRVAVPALLVAATAPPAAPLPATVALPGGDGSRAYVVRVDATTISVEHIDWAVLMKRTFGFDVLTCTRCSRRMRVMATITDPATIRKILQHLFVRADPLDRAPARDPTWNRRPTSGSRRRSRGRCRRR